MNASLQLVRDVEPNAARKIQLSQIMDAISGFIDEYPVYRIFRKKRSRRLRNHVGTDAGNRLQALRRPPRNPRKKHHENESPRPVRNLHGILRLLARAPRRGAGQVSRAPKFKGGKGCKDCPFGLAAANIAIADPPCFPSVKIAHLGGRRWRFPDAVFWRALPPRRSRRLLP